MFQVPMQYCFLQHWTFLPSPVTSTTGRCFCFGSVSSLFLVLFSTLLWAPTDLESSSFSVVSFCLFILFMRFLRQEYWSDLHSLLQWTTFCQNSSLGPVCLGWPCTAWLIASLSYTSPFTMTRQWSVKGQCRRPRFNPRVGKIPSKEVATHSSILAWRILWTEEPGGL